MGNKLCRWGMDAFFGVINYMYARKSSQQRKGPWLVLDALPGPCGCREGSLVKLRLHWIVPIVLDFFTAPTDWGWSTSVWGGM
jgi:hypothetical protein